MPTWAPRGRMRGMKIVWAGLGTPAGWDIKTFFGDVYLNKHRQSFSTSSTLKHEVIQSLSVAQEKEPQ